jgi:hypothetical protein
MLQAASSGNDNNLVTNNVLIDGEQYQAFLNNA